jgi:hypothetical protein
MIYIQVQVPFLIIACLVTDPKRLDFKLHDLIFTPIDNNRLLPHKTIEFSATISIEFVAQSIFLE